VNPVPVRPFLLSDLEAAAELCDRARKHDPAVEPFAHRLGPLATGPRARLDLWRIAQDEDGAAQGIAFAVVREPRSESAPPVLDVYAAVAPHRRRQGLGRALCRAVLGEPAVLRARVREEPPDGRSFLLALGFVESSAQLALSWSARPLSGRPPAALRLRRAREDDSRALELLSREAWAGVPDAFAPSPGEVGRLFAEAHRLVLLAEADRGAIGYLSGVWLGDTLAIEELAVLPGFRRAGIGRALVAEALRSASRAVLSVAESNRAARALYTRLGFSPRARRLVYELRRNA
jgi:ribosomal-protein-alanine N-acetyltransferase